MTSDEAYTVISVMRIHQVPNCLTFLQGRELAKYPCVTNFVALPGNDELRLREQGHYHVKPPFLMTPDQ